MRFPECLQILLSPVPTILLGWIMGVVCIANAETPPSTASPTGQDDLSPLPENAPTLAEIAKANDAAWNAIRSVDVKFEIEVSFGGQRIWACERTVAHWSKTDKQERLQLNPGIQFGFLRAGLPNHSDDYYSDGRFVWHLQTKEIPSELRKDVWDPNSQNLKADYQPEKPRMLASQHRFAGWLQYLRFVGDDAPPPLTLSEIITSWKIASIERKTTDSGDVLWQIHAEYPAKDAADQREGGCMDISVNANKAFLVQSVRYFEKKNPIWREDQSNGVCYTDEVQEFQDCGQGVFFPKRMEYRIMGSAQDILAARNQYICTCNAIQLTVNQPLPDEAFGFYIPKDMVVKKMEDGVDNYVLWGADNKPAKEFENADAYCLYAKERDHNRLREYVERNGSSDTPWNLLEREICCNETKDIDVTIAAISEFVIQHPSSDDARVLRGVAYCWKRETDKAIADFTKSMELAAREDANGWTLPPWDVAPHLLRGAAYLDRGDLLNAFADATEAITINPQSSDAFALRSQVYAQQGEQEKSAADRQTAIRLASEEPGSNELSAHWGVALHLVLLRLVPSLAKP